jgi:hypothetical protein
VTELKLASGCSRTFIETNSEQQQLHNRHENCRFLHDKNIACLTEDVAKESLNKNVSFPFTIFSEHESNHSHNSLSICCCSLFVRVTDCRQTDASFSQSKSLSRNQNHLCPLYRLTIRFISLMKDALILNFHKMSQDGHYWN